MIKQLSKKIKKPIENIFFKCYNTKKISNAFEQNQVGIEAIYRELSVGARQSERLY